MREDRTSLVEEVADDVWLIRLPLPWPLAVVNVYLLRHDDDYVLIDTGLKTKESLSALEGALRHLGLAWTAVRKVIISHMHPDHAGAAAEIRRRSGARVYMHPDETSLVAPRDNSDFFAETEFYLRENGVIQEHIRKMKKNAQVVANNMERFVPDLAMREGEKIFYNGGSFDVLVTPGHSPALLSFYNAGAKLLISTDVLLERITPHIGIHPFYGGDPLFEYLESLETLSQLTVRRVLPAHGNPFQGCAERIEAMKQHHMRRLNKIQDTARQATMHAYDLAGIVWGTERSLTDRRFAMAEALSHLHYLWRHGRAKRSQKEGVIYWSAEQ